MKHPRPNYWWPLLIAFALCVIAIVMPDGKSAQLKAKDAEISRLKAEIAKRDAELSKRTQESKTNLEKELGLYVDLANRVNRLERGRGILPEVR